MKLQEFFLSFTQCEVGLVLNISTQSSEKETKRPSVQPECDGLTNKPQKFRQQQLKTRGLAGIKPPPPSPPKIIEIIQKPKAILVSRADSPLPEITSTSDSHVLHANPPSGN